jgi:cell division protein YceG involved in septum cleavage
MKKFIIVAGVVIALIATVLVLGKMNHDKIMKEGVDTKSTSVIVDKKSERKSTGSGSSRRSTTKTVYYVDYTYQVDGKDYEVSSKKFSSKMSADDLAAKGNVTVRYLAENPGQSIILK